MLTLVYPLLRRVGIVALMSEDKVTDKVEWLLFLLAAVTCAGLVGLYLLLLPLKPDGESWVDLLLALLPNLIAGLLVVIVAYSLFKRKAIPTLTELRQADVQVSNMGVVALHGGALRDFYVKFGQVPWAEFLRHSSSVDIVTWYFDSWIRNHRDELREFFSRGGRIRLVVPDPRVASIMGVTRERYPELDAEDARKKIINTGIRLTELAKESGSKSSRVEVYLSRRMLSYSSLRFDNNTVILSVFDQFRSGQVDSPAFLVDLRKAEALSAYWDKEIGGFFEEEAPLDLPALQKLLVET